MTIAIGHHKAGRLPHAQQLYRQILAQQPNHPDALHLFGLIAHQSGRNDIAVNLISQALAVKPAYPEALNNLGMALKDQGKFDEAVAAYHRAILLKPNWAQACYNLGNALKESDRLDDAIAAYHQAISLKPDFVNAWNNLGVVLRMAGRVDDAVAAYHKAITIRPDYAHAHSSLIYTLHFHPAHDDRTIAEELGRWNRQHAKPLRKFIQPHTNDRHPDRKLRIGYVSPDLGNHPVGRFLLPLLVHHDRKSFEIFAYAQVPRPDGVTQRLVSHTDQWRSISALSDTQVDHLTRQDRIDILVDLTMHTAHNRLLVFARKPAPVQVTWLAYPGSAGLDTIDYRLSDPYLDSPDGDESPYCEKTIRLPNTFWCYQPSIDSVEIGPLPCLKNRFITFGCLNNFCKISDRLLAIWAKILQVMPSSQFLIHAHEGSHRLQLLERMRQEGIDPSRIEFVSKVPLEDYFRLYDRIDIALDTFPYAGGTTTCDALWMGVPVVSLVGNTAVGRGGLSILSNVGLPELAARSQEQYVHIATELANDLPRLTNLRSSLRRRMEQSTLMNAQGFTDQMESAYRRIWRDWCSQTKR